MHAQKKHSKNTYKAANRRRNVQKKRNLRACRLCVKCAIAVSAFTFTLLSVEWDPLKPQPGFQNGHTAGIRSQVSSIADADDSRISLEKTADNPVQAKNNGSGHSAQPEDGSENVSGQAAEARDNQNPYTQDADSGAEKPASSAEPDAGRKQPTANTDEQTRYPASIDIDGQIYYSYAENPAQASPGDGSLIQSVPERLPAGQLIDTTTDDDTEHFTQVSGDWNLILVNPWNEVPKDYEINLTALPNGHSIDSRCYPALMEMMNACRNAGLQPVICSSYRTLEKQKSLFQERMDELLAQGYSKKEAKSIAATSVARPGTSEHQIGLAVDIVDSSHQTLDSMQEYTPVQQWLLENSWKYGFILRYPNDKSRLTGIIYEPWHYRYVGPDAAQEIYERGICLEEYLEEQQ